MIEPERIKILNNNPIHLNGEYVIYWMQGAQRIRFNHALLFSIEKANNLKKPLIVYFEIINNSHDANLRHYQFMLEGLYDLIPKFQKLNITFYVTYSKWKNHKSLFDICQNAVCLFTDKGYLRGARKWRSEISNQLDCQFVEIDTNLLVPVEFSSNKEEYSAYTIRRKIHSKFKNFLNHYEIKPVMFNINTQYQSILQNLNISEILNLLQINKQVANTKYFGGESEAQKLLDSFLSINYKQYSEYRNDLSRNVLTNLSPYLHFGNISPIDIILRTWDVTKEDKDLRIFTDVGGSISDQILDQVKDENGDENFQTLFEELIVRRELAHNFVYYNSDYDSFDSLPSWAKETLIMHDEDKREYIYSLEELENAKTHDPYWNAAQIEMVQTGKMHGYMRMYWGKKVIEWTNGSSEAYDILLYLNNKYELDGRDPNGYAGVAWCFGKHDRAWKERSVFGKVRYMNDKGLERKFDMEKYVDNWR